MRPHISMVKLISMLMPRTGDLFAAAGLPRPLTAPRASQFSLRSTVRLLLQQQSFRQPINQHANFLIARKAFVIRQSTFDLGDLLRSQIKFPIVVVTHGTIR
jgi:hypothetical protein